MSRDKIAEIILHHYVVGFFRTLVNNFLSVFSNSAAILLDEYFQQYLAIAYIALFREYSVRCL